MARLAVEPAGRVCLDQNFGSWGDSTRATGSSEVHSLTLNLDWTQTWQRARTVCRAGTFPYSYICITQSLFSPHQVSFSGFYASCVWRWPKRQSDCTSLIQAFILVIYNSKSKDSLWNVGNVPLCGLSDVEYLARAAHFSRHLCKTAHAQMLLTYRRYWCFFTFCWWCS